MRAPLRFVVCRLRYASQAYRLTTAVRAQRSPRPSVYTDWAAVECWAHDLSATLTPVVAQA